MGNPFRIQGSRSTFSSQSPTREEYKKVGSATEFELSNPGGGKAPGRRWGTKSRKKGQKNFGSEAAPIEDLLNHPYLTGEKEPFTISTEDVRKRGFAMASKLGAGKGENSFGWEEYKERVISALGVRRYGLAGRLKGLEAERMT